MGQGVVRLERVSGVAQYDVGTYRFNTLPRKSVHHETS